MINFLVFRCFLMCKIMLARLLCKLGVNCLFVFYVIQCVLLLATIKTFYDLFDLGNCTDVKW